MQVRVDTSQTLIAVEPVTISLSSPCTSSRHAACFPTETCQLCSPVPTFQHVSLQSAVHVYSRVPAVLRATSLTLPVCPLPSPPNVCRSSPRVQSHIRTPPTALPIATTSCTCFAFFFFDALAAPDAGTLPHAKHVSSDACFPVGVNLPHAHKTHVSIPSAPVSAPPAPARQALAHARRARGRAEVNRGEMKSRQAEARAGELTHENTPRTRHPKFSPCCLPRCGRRTPQCCQMPPLPCRAASLSVHDSPAVPTTAADRPRVTLRNVGRSRLTRPVVSSPAPAPHLLSPHCYPTHART